MRPASPQYGFTLLEFVTVIVVIGLLSVVVAMNTDILGASARPQAEALRAHLRYTQSRALKSGQPWGLSCQGDQCWLFSGNNPGSTADRRPLPGEDGLLVNLVDKGVTITAFNLIFDAYGVPHSSSATPLATALAVTVQSRNDAADSASLTVIPQTGYVQ